MSSDSPGDAEEGEYFAKEGAPTQPGLCDVCGLRPGTECIHNVTGALGGEPDEPDPDKWLCRQCLDKQTVEGWVERVENVDRLMAIHPGSRDEVQQIAVALATHMRAEVERSGLVAPPSIVAFLERYRT